MLFQPLRVANSSIITFWVEDSLLAFISYCLLGPVSHPIEKVFEKSEFQISRHDDEWNDSMNALTTIW